MYIVDGALDVFIDGECKKASTGDTVIFPPRYRYRYSFGGDGRVSYLWVHFTGSHVSELLSSLGIELDCVYDISSSSTEHIKHDLAAIFNEIMLRRNAFDEMCSARLHAVLTRFSRCIESTRKQDLASRYSARIAKSLELIHLHYADGITLDELAEAEHLSKSRYREIFRAALGTSPIEYITSLRIARACELLGMTDLTVTEIAHMCGFEDEPYFCRVFRKSMGTSPLEYRKSV